MSADNVVSLAPKAPELPVRVSEALEVLDDLRDAVITGKVKAFIVAGISPEQSVFLWSGFPVKTAHLEIMGALAYAQHNFGAKKK